MAAPSSGPTIGATPATPWTRFRDFTNRAPEARSTTSERAITIAQPPLKPCTRRAIIITPIDGLSAHTTEASDITTSAPSSGRRRPRWSETGPPTS